MKKRLPNTGVVSQQGERGWRSSLTPETSITRSEAIQHWVLIYVYVALHLQPENGSNIAALAATLLSPALRLSGPIPQVRLQRLAS